MFKFLVFLASAFIIYGLYLEKEYFNGKEESNSFDNDQLEDIKSRINDIEEIIYGFDNKIDEENSRNIMNTEKFDININQSIDDKEYEFQTINSYINGNISLAETCKILGMEKGEVLLLKNLYIESKNIE
ncbi:hypothetical protein E8P77_08340 [Soehngenia saccharolytica]|nr:hypothetical protein E8P77_08340 [Soehngenia saccharolytica]